MRVYHKVLLLAGAATCGIAMPAAAQSTAPVDATEATGSEEIIVMARKRAESLQDVPASVLVVGEAQIENLNAKSLEDLNGVTPNARVLPDGTLQLRGIASNTRNVGFEAGAAVYIDGVYQGRPVGNNQDLSDIAQVEILRGPQGTLYGKNTTAGAFSLATIRPGAQWTGRAEVQYGERDAFRASAYVAGPLVTDVLGIKVAGFRRSADGYQLNVFDGSKYGNQDAYGGRAELRLIPSPGVDIALRGDYTWDNGTLAAPETVSGAFVAFAPGIDTVNFDAPNFQRRKGGGVSLTGDFDLGGGYTLTTISALRRYSYRIAGDDDYSPLDIISHDFVDKSRQFTQEIRVASPSTGFFTWLVGAYYFDQKLDSDRPIVIGTAFPGPQGTGADVVEIDTKAHALFANGDMHITDKLTLGVGLRYTHERKTLDFQQIIFAGSVYPSLDVQDAFSDNEFSPAASLSYKFSPQVTGYLRFSRGYKSGGWNPDITTTADIGFDGESVDNYEAGLRTQFADGRVTLNLTGYYMNYNDLQVTQFFGPLVGNRITNAGKARIKGLEVEVQARPASWLTLAAGGAYNDAYYVDFDNGAGTNYAGRQFLISPKFSGFASADVKVPMTSSMEFKAHGDVRYQSKVYFDNDRTVSVAGPFAQGKYATVNARIGVAFSNGIEVSGFVDNLTNYRPLLIRGFDSFGLGLVNDTYAQPRRFGGRVSFQF